MPYLLFHVYTIIITIYIMIRVVFFLKSIFTLNQVLSLSTCDSETNGSSNKNQYCLYQVFHELSVEILSFVPLFFIRAFSGPLPVGTIVENVVITLGLFLSENSESGFSLSYYKNTVNPQ